MAVVDSEVKRHQDTWAGFVKFLTWSTAGVIVILALMAIFLV